MWQASWWRWEIDCWKAETIFFHMDMLGFSINFETHPGKSCPMLFLDCLLLDYPLAESQFCQVKSDTPYSAPRVYEETWCVERENHRCSKCFPSLHFERTWAIGNPFARFSMGFLSFTMEAWQSSVKRCESGWESGWGRSESGCLWLPRWQQPHEFGPVQWCTGPALSGNKEMRPWLWVNWNALVSTSSFGLVNTSIWGTPTCHMVNDVSQWLYLQNH